MSHVLQMPFPICEHLVVLLFTFKVQELHRKLFEETRRSDTMAFEMKKLEEKQEAVIKEKEVQHLWKYCTSIM